MGTNDNLEHATITLRGLVVPIDWDARGKVTRVALLTPDEQEWRIEPDVTGQRLATHLRQEVVVRSVLVGEPPGTMLRVVDLEPVSAVSPGLDS